MSKYTIYIIHGARCKNCKKWIKELISDRDDFPFGKTCICGKNYSAKELLEDLKGKLKIKEFDSEKLFLRMVKEYLDRNCNISYANEKAIKIVSREEQRFKEKYNIKQGEQLKITGV